MPWNTGKRNWRNATFAHLDIEWATGKWLDITVVLLGVGFDINWNDLSELADDDPDDDEEGSGG
jgi:hypothetical protein